MFAVKTLFTLIHFGHTSDRTFLFINILLLNNPLKFNFTREVTFPSFKRLNWLPDRTGWGCPRVRRPARDRGSCLGPGGSGEPVRSDPSG